MTLAAIVVTFNRLTALQATIARLLGEDADHTALYEAIFPTPR